MEEALNDVGEAIAGAAQDIIDPNTVLQDQGLQDVGEALTEAASTAVFVPAPSRRISNS